MTDQCLKSRTAKICIKEERYIHVEYFAISNLDIADAKTDSAMIKELAGEKKYPIVVNITAIRKISTKARKHLIKRTNYSCIEKAAFIVPCGILAKFLNRVPQKIKLPGIETRSFAEESEALTWLTSE